MGAARARGYALGHVQKDGPMGDVDEGDGTRYGWDAWGREPGVVRCPGRRRGSGGMEARRGWAWAHRNEGQGEK